MYSITSIIQTVVSLLELSDHLDRKKRGEERLRVAFHIAVDPETLEAVPEILVVNEGHRPQKVENLFAKTGLFGGETFPLFVKWGERELPQTVKESETLVMRLADHGTLADVAREKHIRVGVVTDFGDTFVSDWIDSWQKAELRRAVGLDH